ncbi:MAG TPA: hypothetical protein VEI05_06360 [Burkholderiaceae bacterium]|nr:hypothetical protein [Burkholderiaceae bacterium]
MSRSPGRFSRLTALSRCPWAALAALVLVGLLTTAPCAYADSLPLTTTARLLAGVDPGTADPTVEKITLSPAWQQHRKAARAGDRQLKARLDKINQWQARYLPASTRGGTLLYPFSGPDFVNAYALFPDASTYVFFSLEPPGEVPELDRMDAQQLAALFGDLRTALNDLVALNFFITPNMKENLQTSALQGTVPVLLAMMGLLDLQVDAVERMPPWPALTQTTTGNGSNGSGAHPQLPEQGVRITFTNPRTSRQQVLLYLSIDVSDRELRYYPQFLPWLQTFSDPSVLLKSASYLLHGEHFRRLRKQILADANVIVQDDTGIPYKMVKQSGFSISLFGQYERPVKLFEGRFQSDLEEAYEKAGTTEPVPFPFGYNWRKEGKSGLLLAQRAGATH